MKPASQKKNLSILAICAVVILICGLVMANIKTVGGTVTVQDVVISPWQLRQRRQLPRGDGEPRLHRRPFLP